MALTDSQRLLAHALFQSGAIKFGSFKLKLHEKQPDAPLSPIYLNLRTSDNPKPGPLTPLLMEIIGTVMADVVRRDELTFAYVAGIPNAGDPFVRALADALHLSDDLIIGMEKVQEGEQRRIARVTSTGFTPKRFVLPVDDLVTHADTKIEAIRALEEADLVVKDLLVLVDREQGGREQLVEAGYALHSAFTLTELLNFYVEVERIDAAKREEVLAYIAANRVA